MATAGRSESDAPAASDAAARLSRAGVVRLVSARTGDGLAATVLLARALHASDRSFQARLAPLADPGLPVADAGDEVRVAIGRPDLEADLTLGTEDAASASAADIAAELAEPDVALALAGDSTSASPTPTSLTDRADSSGLEREPALAVPTADPVVGLVHSTLLHGPPSGDEAQASDLVDRATGDRELASLVAVETVAAATPAWAAEAVERSCNPRHGGPLETVEGYGDVLEAVAVAEPGTGLAALLGDPDPTALLPAWRAHGRRAHEAVRDAASRRLDGLVVVDCDGEAPLPTVARLVRDFASPEPIVLVRGDGEAVAASRPEGTDLGPVADTVASNTEIRAAGTATRARFVPTGEEPTLEDVPAAIREAL